MRQAAVEKSNLVEGVPPDADNCFLTKEAVKRKENIPHDPVLYPYSRYAQSL